MLYYGRKRRTSNFNSDVTIGFQQFFDNFSDHCTIMKAKKLRFSTSYISALPSPISFKL